MNIYDFCVSNLNWGLAEEEGDPHTGTRVLVMPPTGRGGGRQLGRGFHSQPGGLNTVLGADELRLRRQRLLEMDLEHGGASRIQLSWQKGEEAKADSKPKDGGGGGVCGGGGGLKHEAALRRKRWLL